MEHLIKSEGPLSGVRVLDLSRTLAGAYTTIILADQGAEVLMVEPTPEAKDNERIEKGGFPGAMGGGVDVRYNFEGRNKKSITLNLGSPQGLEIFYELVKRSQVVLDNYRPGVMEKRGLDYPALSQINPRIICCSITGFGSQGPYKDRAAYDTVIQGESGIIGLTGPRGGPPCLAGVPIVDTATAIYSAQAIAAALYYQERTGRGQQIETSLLGVGLSLLAFFLTLYDATGRLPQPEGGHLPILSISGVFNAADRPLVVGALTQRHWRSLCRALGGEDLFQDPRFATEKGRFKHREELRALIEAVLSTKKAREWEEVLVREDVPVGMVNNVAELLAHPQVQSLGLVMGVPSAEGKVIKMVGYPVRMTSLPHPTTLPAPRIGQHTEEVLQEVLGLSRQQIDKLRKQKAI